ncbi:hypothetical protein AX16_010272 [Volvariella volvacea WC 439]|nr:hypothetical protein AX16_010272 [Volvariella volvacea WC 439]
MSNLTSSHLFTQPSPDTEHTLPHFSPLALPGMPYPFFHLLPVEEIEDNEERQLKRAIELSKQTAAAEQHWSSLFGADKRRGVEPILLNPETSHPDPTPVEAPKPSVGGGKPSTLRKKEAKSKSKEAQAKNTDAARSTKRRKQTDSSNRRTSRQRTPNVVLPHSGSENDSAPQRLSFVANEEGLVLSVSPAEIGLLKHADLFFGVGTCSRCKEAIFALTHSVCQSRFHLGYTI